MVFVSEIVNKPLCFIFPDLYLGDLRGISGAIPEQVVEISIQKNFIIRKKQWRFNTTVVCT
jgi:hypothetical protein